MDRIPKGSKLETNRLQMRPWIIHYTPSADDIQVRRRNKDCQQTKRKRERTRETIGRENDKGLSKGQSGTQTGETHRELGQRRRQFQLGIQQDTKRDTPHRGMVRSMNGVKRTEDKTMASMTTSEPERQHKIWQINTKSCCPHTNNQSSD